ncbi:hypothetical protein, partial [Plasmodium yoelii yoelii]
PYSGLIREIIHIDKYILTLCKYGILKKE